MAAQAQTVGLSLDEVNVYVVAGEPVDFTVPVLNAVGDQVNPAGWTGAAQVRAQSGSMLLHAFDVAFSADGARVTASGEETAEFADWGVRAARWDLWVTPPTEDSRPLVRGRVFVSSPITEVPS